MTSIEASTATPLVENSRKEWIKVVLPYALAILIQSPMLMLYFKRLWNRPHYQSFAIAILATFVLALYRWPFQEKQPFHRSLPSDILFVIGLGCAFLGALFVEPWFVACSAMTIVASLFARTLDKESFLTLWPCSLPLFVFLMLPCNLDNRLITKLQLYSAEYTSQMLDLSGLGHHMNGTVINIPGMKEYGIEEACSGIQSFFTLVLVATIFIVAARRVQIPRIGFIVTALVSAVALFGARMALISSPVLLDFSTLVVSGLVIYALVGFHASALLVSAVFWALFMNTMRILTIPLAEHLLKVDLSSGISHDLLGYIVLALGILMLLSTDQFLQFLFGPANSNEEEGEASRGGIGRFLNRITGGTDAAENKPNIGYKPISNLGRGFIWTAAGLVIAFGLYQGVDAMRSFSHPEFATRFFDNDVIVDFEKNDMPEAFGTWKQVDYATEDRHHGADHGQRSDVWHFRTNQLSAVASLDQAFPGWHELTICYRNQGWKMTNRRRREPESNPDWAFIEAEFERSTGEKAYLVFSLFNRFGEGVYAPHEYGNVDWFILAAQNRLSHRIRAQLFQGEAYQIQVFATSFGELRNEQKEEIKRKFLDIREQAKNQFIKKRKQESADEGT